MLLCLMKKPFAMTISYFKMNGSESEPELSGAPSGRKVSFTSTSLFRPGNYVQFYSLSIPKPVW